MKVYLGADHAGYKLKKRVRHFLETNDMDYEDLGTDSEKLVDYPEYAKRVAKKVVRDKGSRGILICGTGTGMVIAANRFKGVRAVAVSDSYSSRMSRFDNDANVLALRGRGFLFKDVEKIMKIWFKTKFSKIPRHKRRIKKLDK